MRGKPARRRARQLRVESLEPRQVLSANPIITEFMASNSATIVDGDGDSSDWIEIYNPGTTAIDLTGWRLTDSASNLTKWTFPATTINPGQYLVVFASDQTLTNYIDPLGYRHTTYALSAGGEYLGLVDPSGVVVSEFAPKYPAQTTDISYGLDGAGVGVYFSHPTPGAVNDFASAQSRGVVISEIMYHPSSELATEEYVEIYNGEAAPVNLTGWQLSGAVDYVLPSMTLATGQYLVIAADVAAFGAKYTSVTNVVGGWDGKLSNRGESVQLVDALGRNVDAVSYYDEGDWAARELGPLDHNHRGWIWSNAHDGGGSSLELVSFSLTNDNGQNWLASTTPQGTPGAVNSVHDVDNNVAPLILDVTQFPIIPSSLDPVTITARLLDELSTGMTATLYWRVDGAPTFTAVPMLDGGAGPDAVAGDQVFSAQLPAMANGTVVEFYVQSADASGNIRTYPAATAPSGNQLTNLLYQVDNSFNPATLPGVNDPPEYRLIMTNAERAELAQIGSSSSDRYSHARMNGTLVTVTSSGVDIRYRVGIRNRGQGSSNRLPNSYHIDIPRDNTWQGLEAFNLNTQYTNAQLAGLRLFQATGAVAEDSQVVKVRVNGTDLSIAGSPSFGVYVQIESSDAVMVANHYPEDDGGNLYKAVRDATEAARADFRDLGTDPAAYAVYYEKQTNSSENDYGDLLELINVLNYEPDATYYDRVAQIVDIDQWLNYFATIAILGSEETSIGTGTGDDYMLYRGENDPRFQLLPHDFDTILGQGDTTGSPTGSIYRAANASVVNRFLYHPQILPAYHARLQELLTTVFAQDNYNALLDQVLTDFTPATRIAAMKTFMDARRVHILGLLDEPLTALAPLGTQGGFPTTTQDNVALVGTASLAGTQSITAGGLVVDYNALAGTWALGDAGGTVTDFISSGDIWSYLDAGNVPSTTPGNDWRVDDPGWIKSGASQLGYGDTQTTVVQYVDTNPGTSGTQKNITTYFRKTFNVTDAASYTALSMRLLRDDGAIVYLNGEIVARSNMPGGTITSTTPASQTVDGSAEDTFFDYVLDPADLVEGQNVIAVEIHQINNTSSDISFDLELTGVHGLQNSTGGVPLMPGINHIPVIAFDGPSGTGNVLASTFVDVWRPGGTMQTVSGSITTPTHWTVAGGPYVVTADLFVEGAGTLTIDPGVTVFFNTGAGLTVRNGGTILAEGTASQRIRFTHNPAAGGSSWDGVSFLNTQTDNRLTYIDMQSGDDAGQCLLVDHARLLVEHATWLDVNAQVLDLVNPTFIIRHSEIPGISGNETIHLFGLNQGEQFVMENNIVGFNTSGDDVMDLGHDTLTPATIYITGNTFLGGYDDGIDTDGFHVVIENNTFSNFHLNTTRNTTSNAVSTGHMTVSGQTISSDLELIGNKFYNNDHHLLLKDLSFAALTHNTMVGATLSAIHFEEPGGTSVIGPGRGADIDSVIFWNNVLTLEGVTAATELMLNRSIVPANLVALGTGNIAADPLLVDPAAGDFSVLRPSPALFAGVAGSDIGAVQTPRYTPASSANLRITEINYDPLNGNKAVGEIGGTSKFLEFIELQNISSETIDLTDVRFDDGITYTFPWLSSLAPGEVIVLAANADLFASRYGAAVAIAGDYSGSLAGEGERVRLLDANDNLIAQVTYGVTSPWPNVAGGLSLEVIDPAANLDTSTNWRASSVVGGTPGIVALPPLVGDYDLDDDVDQDDYAVWRAQFGTAVAVGTGADGNRDGLVDSADYTVWRDNLGTSRPAAIAVGTSLVAALEGPAASAFVDESPAAVSEPTFSRLAALTGVDSPDIVVSPACTATGSCTGLDEAFAAIGVSERAPEAVAGMLPAANRDYRHSDSDDTRRLSGRPRSGLWRGSLEEGDQRVLESDWVESIVAASRYTRPR